jgi:hypothetical protein
MPNLRSEGEIMSHPSRQPVKAEDTQFACAAAQVAALVGHTGTQTRTTFAAPEVSQRRKAMPKSAKLLSFGLLAVVAVAAGKPRQRRKN